MGKKVAKIAFFDFRIWAGIRCRMPSEAGLLSPAVNSAAGCHRGAKKDSAAAEPFRIHDLFHFSSRAVDVAHRQAEGVGDGHDGLDTGFPVAALIAADCGRGYAGRLCEGLL